MKKNLVLYRDFPRGGIFGIARDSEYFENVMASEGFYIQKEHKNPGFRFLNARGRIVFLSKPSPVWVYNNKVTLVRIHDIFPITNPEWFRWRTKLVFKISLYFVRVRNHILIFNSEFTRDEYSSRYKISKNLIVSCPTVLEGNSEACPSNNCLAGINDQFQNIVLSVGTIEPRKNQINTVENFLKSKISEKYLLVLVGRRGHDRTYYRSFHQKIRNNKKILHLEKVCDFCLKVLYQNVKFFISASLAEGFDIPAHEASNFGMTLVLSDIPVHREFFDNVIWFNPKINESLLIALNEIKVLKANELRIQSANGEFKNLLVSM
jgi:glycosyltransferase involved in cell wall biosynthesis